MGFDPGNLAQSLLLVQGPKSVSVGFACARALQPRHAHGIARRARNSAPPEGVEAARWRWRSATLAAEDADRIEDRVIGVASGDRWIEHIRLHYLLMQSMR